MVKKRRPASPVAKNFVPPGNMVPYRVNDGDSWESIAGKFGLRTWFLIEYNFPTLRSVADHQQKCEEVNWYLYENVGCRLSTDGKNYSFSSIDNPGLVYIPIFPDVPKVESYFVPGTLRRVVPQLDLLCWAAAATIMMSWKDVKPYSILDAIGRAGEPWLTRYKKREGLPWAKTGAFLSDAGLNGGVFPCGDARVWMKVLESKGPVACGTVRFRTLGSHGGSLRNLHHGWNHYRLRDGAERDGRQGYDCV